jgi:phosphoribulokinase
MARQLPIILGLVGDSAAGKSTLSSGVMRILGADNVTRICTDDYHKYDRRERARMGLSALHPACNYLDVLELDLERLHHGQPILKPVYDHATGSHSRPEYVQPRQFVIVDGLLGFATPGLRQYYDVKVYLDPPEELRRVWKIKRDTAERGYTVEQVLQALEQREADSREFIRPQRNHADIVVRFYPPADCRPEEAGSGLNVQLVLRPTIPHPDLSELFEPVPGPTEAIRLELGRDNGRPADFLAIDGGVTPEQAARLEEAIWVHLPGIRPLPEDQFGDYRERGNAHHSHPLALTQLLLTFHLLRKYGDIVSRLSAPAEQPNRAQSVPIGLRDPS